MEKSHHFQVVEQLQPFNFDDKLFEDTEGPWSFLINWTYIYLFNWL